MGEFAIANISAGKLNALVKNLMHQMGTTDAEEAVRRINSGEWKISQPARLWREENGIIYFSVTSDGTTGPEWIERFRKKGSDYAKSILNSPDFKPTKGVTTEIAVIRGKYFSDSNRTTKNIRAEAEKRNWLKPNAEVACLIREKFSDKELEAMGLWWIVVMHEPIKDSDGDPRLLSASRSGDGGWLDTFYDDSDGRWNDDGGFAFAVPPQ